MLCHTHTHTATLTCDVVGRAAAMRWMSAAGVAAPPVPALVSARLAERSWNSSRLSRSASLFAHTCRTPEIIYLILLGRSRMSKDEKC